MVMARIPKHIKIARYAYSSRDTHSGTQRPIDRLGLPIDHDQEYACGSRRLPAPLLPILDRALIDAKVLRKRFLRQAQFLTNGPNVERRRDMHPVLASVGLSGRVRQHLPGAGEYPIAGFRHTV